MAKVLGVHEVELGAGADPAEFERLVAATMAEAMPDGMSVRLFKADRGRRNGTYLILIQLDSVETRDRIFPFENEDAGEVLAFFEAHPTTAEAWNRLREYEPTTDVATDYVEIDG
jgi:hypothetical protein